MEISSQNTRSKGTYWLISLRWIAIACVVVAAILAEYVYYLRVELQAVLIIAAGLCIENIISLILLAKVGLNQADRRKARQLHRVINFQISFDLIALGFLIHFTGGVENPIYYFYLFHMVIGSLLLSPRDSYLQALLAISLLWFMALGEFYGWIPHYEFWLKDPLGQALYADPSFVYSSLAVFSITLILMVYMVNFVVALLRKQELALMHANNKLKQMDKIKEEYVARVTHNIKGHLSVIQTNLEVVCDPGFNIDEATDKEMTVGALNRAKRLTLFVNDLLKLTQMRLSDHYEMEEFSLRDLLLSLIEMAGKDATHKEIRLLCHIDDNVNSLYSNRFSVEDLVSGLIYNAIKYTNKNGIIELNVTDHRNTVCIEVADTGIGIPADELPYIFNEFYRASNARELVTDGTGLGLPMAKYIVERCGGTIKVKSQMGLGTRFFITLPKKGEK